MCATHGSDVARRATEAAMSSRHRIITIDREAQRVRGASLVQGGNRDRAAAEHLSTDCNGWQSWKRRAGKHMVQSEHMPVVIEKRLGPRCQVHCPEHQPD